MNAIARSVLMAAPELADKAAIRFRWFRALAGRRRGPSLLHAGQRARHQRVAEPRASGACSARMRLGFPAAR
jgi:hypothetical protein